MNTSSRIKIWHAQATILDGDFVTKHWLVWNGKTWTIGKREAFKPIWPSEPESFLRETLNGDYGGVGFVKKTVRSKN